MSFIFSLRNIYILNCEFICQKLINYLPGRYKMESITQKMSYLNISANDSPQLHTETDTRLSIVTPHKFLGVTCPCQLKAAKVRNRLIKSINNNETDMVAFRYLESKKMRYSTALEAMMCFALPMVIPYSFYNQQPFLSCTVVAASLSDGIINVGNTRRYEETSQLAADYLEKKLSLRTCVKIEDLLFIKKDFDELLQILSDHNVNTSLLEAKLREKAITQNTLE